MNDQTRLILTQELVALTSIIISHYEHKGFMMFDAQTIYGMEKRQAWLAMELFG